MKKALLIVISIVIFVVGYAQKTEVKPLELPPLDKSPMDVSYFPDNFPIKKLNGKTKETLIARVLYSRPQKSGRVIFGELIEYNTIWRLGANESSEIDIFKPIKINKVTIPVGRYSIFCIPNLNTWTIIINKDVDNWGAFNYNIKNDLVRITLPVVKTIESQEVFTIFFSETKIAKSFNMNIAWDNITVSLPIQVL